MESSPRGAALIINNKEFEHLDQRDGTDHDCEMLKQLFESKLNFAVEVQEDLKGEVPLVV